MKIITGIKRLLTISILLVSPLYISAQDHLTLKSFLTKYSDNYVQESFGKICPEYYFNQKLNTQTLRGKAVILDFWATWCSACHNMSHDLDSILIRGQFSNDYSIIAINYQESKHVRTKQGAVKAYWQKQNHGFPMVEGVNAELLGDSLKAGHPTVILVDSKGFIRGRWDSYTPTTVPLIRAAIWVIMHPDAKYDKNLLRSTLSSKNWALALFVSEQLVEDEEVFWAKLHTLLYISEWDAYEYVKKHYETISMEKQQGEEYEDKLWNIMGEIVEANVLSIDLNKFGINIFDELCNNFEGYNDDYVVLDYASRLYWRTGQKDKARECIAKCLKICKEKKLNRKTVDYFNNVAKNYQK